MNWEEYLTNNELAARLKISPKTIRNKMALGISPIPMARGSTVISRPNGYFLGKPICLCRHLPAHWQAGADRPGICVAECCL